MSTRRNFERRLPKPVGPFRTLADVRVAIMALHDDGQLTQRWEYVGALALEAAETGNMEM
jgi:hypothetical protein